MTTDTVPKEVVVVGDGYTVGGMAKGAAMLAPNMATMLAVCTTDAAVDPATLQAALAQAVASSFNTITVDGATSTNDTVLVLASGQGARPSADDLTAALTKACRSLAEQMVADAEGATKVAHVRVRGAQSDQAAHVAARKVADSMLVQCSLFGEDPYWGRIVSELGSAGTPFDIDAVSVAYGGVVVCAGGVAAPHDADAVKAHLAGRHIEIDCDLGLGTGEAVVLGHRPRLRLHRREQDDLVSAHRAGCPSRRRCRGPRRRRRPRRPRSWWRLCPTSGASGARSWWSSTAATHCTPAPTGRRSAEANGVGSPTRWPPSPKTSC